jgi:hypothetical protein
MNLQTGDVNELKHRIRKLKQVEFNIRFNRQTAVDDPLVWDRFFDLRGGVSDKARYGLGTLSAMSREEYKRIIDEYFALVYYEYYKENGILSRSSYDPEALALLGLPFCAGEADVKKRFRELAKKYHPDTGGDAAKFIELMKLYEKLTGR